MRRLSKIVINLIFQTLLVLILVRCQNTCAFISASWTILHYHFACVNMLRFLICKKYNSATRMRCRQSENDSEKILFNRAIVTFCMKKATLNFIQSIVIIFGEIPSNRTSQSNLLLQISGTTHSARQHIMVLSHY